MFSNIENLTFVSTGIMTAVSAKKPFTRKTNGFIFVKTGSMTFHFTNKSITVNTGEMIFIPIHEAYTRTICPDTKCTYMSIRFLANIENPEPVLYKLDGYYDKDYVCNHFADLWNMGNSADRYKCYSLFYNLLAYISNNENQNYAEKKKFEIIKPALEYLKSHIFDTSLKVDSLHYLCGISDTYFRRIFIAEFGTTPQKYITAKRLSQAESIIISRNFDSLSDVAYSVGYSDPLYFSKLFTKKFGVSPSKYK